MLLSAINPIDFITSINNENNVEMKEINVNDKSVNKNNKVQINENERNNDETETSGLTQKNTKNDITKFEKYVDSLFKFFTSCLHILGPLFIISLTCFIVFTYISMIKTLIPYWGKKTNKNFTRIIKIITSIQVLYIIINYLLATIVKPGSPNDLKKSKFYKKQSAYYSSSLELPPINIKKAKRLREENPILWKKCKYCQEVKPLRTHHCSICNACVLKMDHHCPWVNNCIGQNNQRYFLLFLGHLFFYAFIVAILSFPMVIDGYFFKNENEFKLICILSMVGVVILTFFNLWNWYLAVSNSTTIEFFGERTGLEVTKGIKTFNFGNWRKNLFYVFGTSNILSILFIPSIKMLPFSGLEWSRHLDKNFIIDGIDNCPNNKSNEIVLDISI